MKEISKKYWNMALTKFGKQLIQSPCANCEKFDYLLNLLFNTFHLNKEISKKFKHTCKCGKEMDLIEIPYSSSSKFYFIYECECGLIDCVPKEQMIKYLEGEK